MNFFERVTGSDMTKEMKAFEARVKDLPRDYQDTWEEMQNYLWPHSDITGRNLMPIFDGIVSLFEETAADGQSVEEVVGDDIKGFCLALTGAEGVKSYRDKWRDQLNSAVAKKLNR